MGEADVAPETIETENLVLTRSVDSRDKPMLTDRIMRGGPTEFTRWSGFVVPDMGAGVVGEELDRFTFESDNDKNVCYSIFPKCSGDMVGYVSLVATVDEFGLASYLGLPVGREYTEIEWFIFKEARGRGFAEEAVGTVLAGFFGGKLLEGSGCTVTAMVGSRDAENLEAASRLGFRDPLATGWPEPDDDDGDEPHDPIGVLRMLTLEGVEFERAEARLCSA